MSFTSKPMEEDTNNEFGQFIIFNQFVPMEEEPIEPTGPTGPTGLQFDINDLKRQIRTNMI